MTGPIRPDPFPPPGSPAPPSWFAYAGKAFVAAASLGVVALSSLLLSLTPDSAGGSSVTTVEWVRLAIAVLTAIGGTYGVYKIPNNYARKP